MKVHDYIVVGSGCSGSMVAQTLVESGAKVTMLDVGYTKESTKTIPNKDFITLRKADAGQRAYLIGDQAEGVHWGKVGKGEQITPPRKHIAYGIDTFIPTKSDNFSSLESLGYGGLGIGWGLQSWEYTKPDLEAAGLDYDKMSEAYQVVANRIGISATKDDAAAYTIGTLENYQASPKLDKNHDLILRKYQKKKSYFKKRGFVIGRTPLALITKDKGRRKGYKYKDMDFYSDNDQSAWRPWMTVDQLKKASNFTYVSGYLVLSFKELKHYTAVECINVNSNKKETFYCRKLILASGALGSARIVLRSKGKPNDKLPLLCNSYSYVPCIQPRFLGKAAEKKKLGFTQLSLFLDSSGNGFRSSVASLYGYQSLMLFRIVKQVPLNFRSAKTIMRYLMSGIVILGIHHPDNVNSKKYVRLVPNKQSATGDILNINYELSDPDKLNFSRREKQFMKAVRRTGTFPLKKVDPGNGASIHYAGTVPFSATEKPLHLSPDGKLYDTKNVYIADSSGFNYLPAPGLTFSLMANAHNTAKAALLYE